MNSTQCDSCDNRKIQLRCNDKNVFFNRMQCYFSLSFWLLVLLVLPKKDKQHCTMSMIPSHNRTVHISIDAINIIKAFVGIDIWCSFITWTENISRRYKHHQVRGKKTNFFFSVNWHDLDLDESNEEKKTR